MIASLQAVEAQRPALEQKDTIINQLNAAVVEQKSKVQRNYQSCVELQSRNDQLRQARDQERVSLQGAFAKITELEESLVSSQAGEVELQSKLDEADLRLTNAAELKGQLWQFKSTQAFAPFRPQEDRSHVIMSVLNLKGGVGKTTISSHLAGALARRGKRVLVIDLDLQGSLTGFMLPQIRISERFHAKRLLQDYFRPRAENSQLHLQDFVVKVEVDGLESGQLHLVPTTDELAYAELSLNMNWLLKQGKQDARFALRDGLHSQAMYNSYDVVILDCPPLLNISAVNALAASDYLLIPAIQGEKALERIPKLITTVLGKDFSENINDRLRILEVVANRTTGEALPQGERQDWDKTVHRINTLYSCGLKRLSTSIPRTQEVQNTETAYKLPPPSSTLFDVFNRLSEEIESEISNDHRNAAPLLRKPGELFGAIGG